MTLDYEELKSSCLSTDEEEETAKETADLRLSVLSSHNTDRRTRSVQLPPLEQGAVLRQSHSDPRDHDPDAGTDTARADSCL